jgi:hypothetical protein
VHMHPCYVTAKGRPDISILVQHKWHSTCCVLHSNLITHPTSSSLLLHMHAVCACAFITSTQCLALLAGLGS